MIDQALSAPRSAGTSAARVTSAQSDPVDGRRPHVCFVAMNIYPVLSGSQHVELVGGAEVQQALLLRILSADGFRVSVLTADYGQNEQVDVDGVTVHRIRPPANRGVKGLRLLHPHMTDIVAALDRIDPDIVYFRVAGFRAAAAAWYARRRGKQFVYACASDLELERKLPETLRDALLFRLALRSADHVLIQNTRQHELLKKNFGKDGILVPNCYVETGVKPASHAGHVLWVGTVKPIKSPEIFIELARRNPAKTFCMVGGADNQNDGQAYYERLRNMAAEVPNLRFLGHVPYSEVGHQFDGASLFVNTSATEGFPNTFLQAWIRGVPTLSFVCPEVVPGRTGTIACRDLDALSRRVGELTSSPERWQLASDACKAHFAENHSIERVLQRYRDLFERARQPRSLRHEARA